MKLINKFQMGGEIPAEQPMPEEQAAQSAEQTAQAGGDPLMQIVEVLMQLSDAGNQALQSNDPNALSQVVQGLIQFTADLQAQIGGGEQETPVFKKGGKISKMKKMGKSCKK